MSHESIIVQNNNISLTFSLSNGISVTGIHDKVNGNEFLTHPSPLFSFAVNNGWQYFSDTSNIQGNPGVLVDKSALSNNGMTLTVNCHVNDILPLHFEIVVDISADAIAALIGINVTNKGKDKLKIKIISPCIKNLTVPGYDKDKNRMMGMIPQEIGGVGCLHEGMTLGMIIPDYISTLPCAMNIMEVADMYDREDKGGIFFADIDGSIEDKVSPVQFVMKEQEIYGSWMHFDLEPGITLSSPRVAIGVHSGNYTESLSYYMKAHAKKHKAPKTPTWLKEAGGVWTTGTAGLGGPYMLWDYIDLNKQISSFSSLPDLYDQAEAMGTNAFLLNDYWEGEPDGFPRYWTKGDYIPREDLGGESALISAIDKIHGKGGKVIMYLDPILISYDSVISQQHGVAWGGRMPNDSNWFTNYISFSMLPNFAPWQEYFITLAKKLVDKYGADGIYLDTYGWRFNANVKNYQENILHTPQEWNEGVYALIDMLRDAITSVKPDAVVLCESASGGLWRHAHGGLSSDFSRSAFQTRSKITASPVRTANPEVNFFSNGLTIGHLVQVFASGHSLALNFKWSGYTDFIKKLLDIRREFKDALIYGQMHQPDTNCKEIATYYYTGSKNCIITLVNFENKSNSFEIDLLPDTTVSLWKDLLTGKTYNSEGGKLIVNIESAESVQYGLAVLQKSI